jgi:hypothetical protein
MGPRRGWSTAIAHYAIQAVRTEMEGYDREDIAVFLVKTGFPETKSEVTATIEMAL